MNENQKPVYLPETHQVFSIKDVKSKTFGRPWQAINDAVAIRSFSDAINAPESQFRAHAEDYVLYRLGSFNDFTGVFVNEESPISLACGSDLVR